jgi:hypothetical protein
MRLESLATLVLAASLLAVAAPATATEHAGPAGPEPATFQVGFATRDITPTPALSEDGDGNVYLGGFGLGPGRISHGVDHRIEVRAVVVGDGADAVALASVEVQGSFAAYENGDYGWWDVIQRVTERTDLTRDDVLISSDHSHRAPDTTGAWGFVPDAYARYVADQTEAAIVEAYGNQAPSHLRVGSLDAREFLSSDFYQPGQNLVDAELRVLVAENPADGTVRGVYGQFAAHPTVEGSGGSQPGISPDWPGVVSDMVANRLDGDAVLAVGAIGRTHEQDPPGVDSDAQWEAALADRVLEAVAGSGYVTEDGVESDTDMVSLTAWNAGLLALTAGGDETCRLQPTAPQETCVPIQRDETPPWQAGNVLRTLVSTARIGDVFLWGVPGELYPNAHWTVEHRVPAREHFVMGLTNDQLGYLIAPTEAWPVIAAHSPVSDNALFNVDPTSGDHLACAALDSAREIGFTAQNADSSEFVADEPLFQTPARCQAWSQEDRSLPGERGALGGPSP